MFARSTTIDAQTASIDAGIAYVRDEVMPMITGLEGCTGLSMMVDRMSGRCIITSAWRSEDAMRASDAELRPIRARAGERLGGSGSPEIDEWEIVAMHRDHRTGDGSAVRATWTQVAPDQVNHAIDTFRMSTLPAIEALDGFCSASLMVNRSSGRAVVSVTYDDHEAMERNRDEAAAVRASGMQDAGSDAQDVCEFDLAVAHLRVPEMA